MILARSNGNLQSKRDQMVAMVVVVVVVVMLILTPSIA